MKQATQLFESWRRAGCSRHNGPGIPSGAFARHHLFRRFLGIAVTLVSAGCSHSAPSSLLSVETTRGKIQYTLHSPATPRSQRVILAHGFLRNPQTMHHLAESFAKDGIETASIKLKRSTPFNGRHDENARDMTALRQALGWQTVTYAGFSAGGLSALIAAAEDPACTRLLLLDPVDHASLGKDAAAKIRIPTLAIVGQPGPGNAQRNCAALLSTIPGCGIVEILVATHCDFEARPSALCHQLTGSKPDATRTAKVHETLLRESNIFLKQQSTIQP